MKTKIIIKESIKIIWWAWRMISTTVMTMVTLMYILRGLIGQEKVDEIIKFLWK